MEVYTRFERPHGRRGKYRVVAVFNAARIWFQRQEHPDTQRRQRQAAAADKSGSRAVTLPDTIPNIGQHAHRTKQGNTACLV